MVPRDVHLTLQPQTQTIRSSLQRTLQDPVCGRQRHWLPEKCVRLRAFESGARQIALGQAAAFGLPMEQLRGISQKAEKSEPLATGGSATGRTRHTQGQCCRARGIPEKDGTAADL